MPFGPILRSLRHNKTRFVLIVLEIAFTLAIVANCVNMILSEREQMSKVSGFDDAHLVFVGSRHFTPFADANAMAASLDHDVRTLRSVPGVRAAANSYFIPWQGGGSSDSYRASNGATVQAQQYETSPGMFDTLGVKIVEGRGFTPQDYPPPSQDNTTSYNVVISRAFERLLFPNGHGLGQTFTNNDGRVRNRIVGIIDQFYNPYGWPIGDFVVFLPDYAGSRRGSGGFLVRTSGPVKDVVPQLEKALLAGDADRVLTMRTVLDMKDNYFAGGRIVVKAMTAIILLVIFVTGIGILGLTSLSVTERTRQIGTRRALGATRRDILVHFLLENWMVTTVGLAFGVVLAYALNFLLVSHVSDAKMDWRLIAVGILLLWANGILATMFPALRASGVSPAIATRSV
jgi:putative ABC transport system permease protein